MTFGVTVIWGVKNQIKFCEMRSSLLIVGWLKKFIRAVSFSSTSFHPWVALNMTVKRFCFPVFLFFDSFSEYRPFCAEMTFFSKFVFIYFFLTLFNDYVYVCGEEALEKRHYN